MAALLAGCGQSGPTAPEVDLSKYAGLAEAEGGAQATAPVKNAKGEHVEGGEAEPAGY